MRSLRQHRRSLSQTAGAHVLLLLCSVLALLSIAPVSFLAAPSVARQHDVAVLRAVATQGAPEGLASSGSQTSTPSFLPGAWFVVALGALSALKQKKRQEHSKCRSSPVALKAVATDSSSEAMPFVTLKNSSGDTAKVYTLGACVTSYVKNGKETLALRKDNVLDGSKPIAGGIPLCFPQFGPGTIQQHGFARNMPWTVVEMKDGPEPQVVLKLQDNAETRAMWDYPFEAIYSVALKAGSLEVSLQVKNTGSSSFDFTSALHSYWNVSDISNAKVVGDFAGKTYLNRIEKPFKEMVNSAGGNEVMISEPTDRVYKGITGDVMLQDSGNSSCLTLRSSGWSDTVIWNPFGDEKMGYDKFLCVEAAQSWEPVTLAPSGEWVGKMDVQCN